MTDFVEMRRRMVERQIARRGVKSRRVLDAMRKVPRERFLPNGPLESACSDGPMPIGDGQTISQPYIVAYMTEELLLDGGEKVLEIGTGSGYAAAVLAEIAGEVYSVERIAGLATMAASLLADLGYDNVYVRHGDGTLGWAEEAPFDAIVVAAGGPAVPETLKQQLRIGGRLVMPVGTSSWCQALQRVTRTGENEFETDDLIAVRFVPLIGKEGWDAGH